MHHTTRIPLIHRMMAVMLADHRWSTRRPFEGATRCDKSYICSILVAINLWFFSESFLRRKFHCRLIRLADFPVFALCGVGFFEALRWHIGSIGSQWLPAPPFPLPLPPFAMTCSLNWSMDSPADFGLCQPSVNVSPEKNKQNHAKSIQLHSQSVPNFDSSYYLLLARFCWLHKLYILSHAPAHYLLTSERSAAPSLRFFMGGVMKSGRFVPSSFSPCALTQLPKNMPVAQQAQWFGCMSVDFWRWMAQNTRKVSCMSFLKILRPVAVSSRPEFTNPGLHTTANHELDSAQLFLTMCVWTGAAQHTVLTVFPFVAQLLRDVELSSKVSIS